MRACVREDPFKCINNEKPVTGMSSDIGPVVMYVSTRDGGTTFNISSEIREIEKEGKRKEREREKA